MTVHKLTLLNELVGAFGTTEAMKVKKMLYCNLCGRRIFGPGRAWQKGDLMCHCERKTWANTVTMIEDGTLWVWGEKEL